MDMDTYLGEVAHAVDSLLGTIWSEGEQIAELGRRLEGLTGQMRNDYAQAQSLFVDASDPDEVAEAAGRHWGTYFGPDKEHSDTKAEIQDLEELKATRDFSRRAMSAAVLQIAKQGIGIVHASAHPDGREVGSSRLRDVVWEGRNQAIHWEEGSLRCSGVAVFTALKRDFGEPFNRYNTENLAHAVIAILGWTDLGAFETDMRSLA